MKKTFNTLPELYNEMYKLGIQNMDRFLTDIIEDIDYIRERSEESSHFVLYWIVRKNGTHTHWNTHIVAEIEAAWSDEHLFTKCIRVDKRNGHLAIEMCDKGDM